MFTISLLMVFIALLLWAAITDQFYGMVISLWNLIGGTVFSLIMACIAPSYLFLPLAGNSHLGYLDGITWQASKSISNFFLLLFALAVWSIWNYSLVYQPYKRFSSFRRSFNLWLKKHFREVKNNFYLVPMFLIGMLVIVVVWRTSVPGFLSLFTSLIGLAFGLLFLWSIRIAAGVGLGIEALGFGDVLLLAMIGSWMGWQLIFPVFFLAIFLGIFFGLASTLFCPKLEKSNNYIQFAFGPAISVSSIIIAVWFRLDTNMLIRLLDMYGDYTEILTPPMMIVGYMLIFISLIFSLKILALYKRFRSGKQEINE